MSSQPLCRRSIVARILVWVTILHLVGFQCMPGYVAIAAEYAAAKKKETAAAKSDAKTETKKAGAAEKSAPAREKKVTREREPLPEGAVTIGGRLGDGVAEGTGDLLVPLWYSSDAGMLFLNPRSSVNDDSAEEFNLGLGFRTYCPRIDAIFGVNAFYDYRWTENDAEFEQWGFGVEYLSEWVDARANYYLPEDDIQLVDTFTTERTGSSTSKSRFSTTSFGDVFAEGNEIQQGVRTTLKERTTTTTTTTKFVFEQFEAALEGWDAEIGVKIPGLSEIAVTRIFIGYQSFDNPFGDDLEGATARFESWVLPGVALDAQWFEEDKLNGTDYFVGARVRLPFDLGNLSQGRNPFEGDSEQFRQSEAKQEVRDRMSEMVMRDPKVQTTGKVEENEALRTSTSHSTSSVKDIKTSKHTVTVLDNVTFVSNSNIVGNGTAEHPYSDPQTGIDSAGGNTNVYVFAGNGPYNQNVVISDGIALLGEGCEIEGLGGESFGGHNFPVIDGNSLGPSVTMGNNSKLQGFKIINTDWAGPTQTINIANFTFDIQRVGVLASNVNNFEVNCNIIENNEHGALFVEDSVSDFRMLAINNIVQSNDLFGMGIASQGASGTTDVTIADSSFVDNGVIGLAVVISNKDAASAHLFNLAATGNGGPGIAMEFINNGTAYATVEGAFVAGNDDFGLGFLGTGNGTDTYELSDVGAIANGNHGVAGIVTGASINVVISDSYSSQNGVNGFDLNLVSPNGSAAVNIFDTSAQGNFLNGVNILAAVRDTLTINMLGGNDSFNEGGDGVNVVGASASNVFAVFSGLTANGNNNHGVQANLQGAFGVNAGIFGIDANGNLGGDGIELFAQSLTGSVFSSIADITANLNAQEGVNAFLDGTFGVLSSINNIQANSNLGGNGVDLSAQSLTGGVISSISGITANFNDLNGMDATLNGNLGVLSSIGGVQANNNISGDGVNVFAQSLTGSVISSISDITANFNSQNGMDVFLNGNFSVLSSINGVQANNNLVADGVTFFAQSLTGGVVSSISDIQANTNGRSGVDAFIAGTFTAQSGMAGIEANNNLGNDGITFIAQSESGAVTATFSDVLASGNGNDGLFAQLAAQFNLNATFTDVTANDNASNGMFLAGGSESGSVSVVVDPSSFSRNGSNGLFAAVSAFTDLDMTFQSVTANDNAHNGLFISGGSDTGAVSLVIDSSSFNRNGSNGVLVAVGAQSNLDVTIQNVTASDNGGNGFFLSGGSSAGAVNLVVDPSSFNRNDSHGIFTALSAVGDMDATFQNVTANDNGGNGLFFAGGSDSGSVSLVIDPSSFSRNDSNGLLVALGARSNFNVVVQDVAANDNGASGMFIVGGSSSGEVSVVVDSSSFSRNDSNGIFSSFTSLGDMDVILEDVTANDNAENGTFLSGNSDSGTVSVVIDPSSFSRNGNSGLFVGAGGLLNASVVLQNVTVNDNASHGLFLSGGSQSGGVSVAVNSSSFSRNGSNGLFASLSAQSNVSAILQGVTANNNSSNGIFVSAGSSSGSLSFALTQIAASGNGAAGAFTVGSAASDVSVLLNHITANSNQGGDGVLFTGGGGTGTMNVVAGSIVANGNARAGVDVGSGLVAQNNISASFSNITANGNGDNGLIFGAISLSGTVQAAFQKITVNGNAGVGASIIEVGDQGVSAVLANVKANNNGLSGLNLSVVSTTGDATVVLSGVTTTNNNSTGMNMAVAGYSNGSLVVVNSLSTDNHGGPGATYTISGLRGSLVATASEFTDNVAGGLVGLVTGGTNASAVLTGVTAKDNSTASGITMSLASGNSASLVVVNSEATHNAANGLLAILSAGDNASAVLQGVRTDRNVGSNGVQLILGASNVSVVAVNNISTRNDADGININANAINTGAVIGVGNVFARNGDDGVQVTVGAPTPQIDFGNGAFGSAGSNSIFNNFGFDFNNSGAGTAVAENNWWGTPFPSPLQFNGSVDFIPALASDPND